MKRKRDIGFGLLLLLAAVGCFHSCQQDAFEELIPDPETLIAQGRYVTARNAETATAADALPFEINTPYRLLAFTKAYQPGDAALAAYPRFNKVAWEGMTSGELHYISLDQPDKWLGFAALEGEPVGSDGLVSLDFYGFTYGKPVANRPPTDYIELDGLTGETTPAAGSLASLKRTETVSADGTTLNDLLRGELFNQNIATAGKASASSTQSIVPFKHCFSKLEFFTGQQPADEVDEEGNPLPTFPDIQLEKVEVTGTYLQGSVYLQDGKVELLGDPAGRPLAFNDQYKGAVTIKDVKIGEMLVFPSDGSALKNADKADGYSVGLNITVKSKNRTNIEKFLANTHSPNQITEVTENGTTYYRGTIVKTHILDNFNEGAELHFKQNTRYELVIRFQKDDVRIITVIPQVEEWLPGEGTPADPWQDQAMGQPQMFDNIVWSDRNLGADHYDPFGENFEKTIGYFYQSGRNIPYYPFDTENYYQDGKFTGHPDPYKKNESILADVEPYGSTSYRFYPIVDPEILNMKNQMAGWGSQGSQGSNRTWTMEYWDKPQLYIPEKKPTDASFDFIRSKGQFASGLSNNSNPEVPTPEPGKEKCDMDWSQGQHRQPVAGLWVIPSSSDFLSIFPSTPHAGNITFRAGGWNNNPMSWGGEKNDMDAKYKVVRVTVPFYYEGMSEPTGRSENYRKAWRLLRDSSDFGTTCLEAYTTAGPNKDTSVEPDGDPEDGYASVYVISREREQDVEGLPAGLSKSDYYIQEWGTIYAIKRAYTPQAYRMRWRVICAGLFGERKSPGLYVEICRYRCKPNDAKKMNETEYKEFDWDHPAARLYFPICGLGDWTGAYINFGTECQYATCDKIVNGNTSALQIKITGHDAYNAYMAVIREPIINRDFGRQIRPIRGGAINR